MTPLFIAVSAAIITTILGGATGLFIFKGGKHFDIERKRKTAEEIMTKAKEETEEIKKETEMWIKKRREAIEENNKKREERAKKLEAMLAGKEELLKKKDDRNKEKRLFMATLEEEVQGTKERLKKTDLSISESLSQKTGQTKEKLEKEIIKKYLVELENQNAEETARIEEHLKENAGKKARNLIVTAIQRLLSPTSVERRAVNIIVPKDHIKGKIVGKDGVNIEEFERLLDVDVIFNDLPNTISISAFMLVKRRIAQRAMEKLVKIHGDIDKKVVAKTIVEAEKETNEELSGIGKRALEKMNIDKKDQEFARIVGRLEYRTSYGQNIMKHSMEVGWLAAILGSELGLNVDTCRIGGFLHDLGKAIDQDPSIDKPHDLLSKELMEKFGFSWEEVHAAWTHHDAIPQETPEAMIVKAADAISAGRPGARQESFEKYLERINALRKTAEAFTEIKGAYAISAGRELRAIVDPEKADDKRIKVIAKELARKIEQDLTYPGQIKVNVIRRIKHTEIAK